MIYYKDQTVAELRRLTRDRQVGSGVWRAGASKNDLIRALLEYDSGKEPVVPRTPKLPKLPEVPAPNRSGATDDLGAVIAKAIEPHVSAQLDVDQVINLIKEHSPKGMDTDTLVDLCIGIIKDHTAPRGLEIKQASKPTVKLDRQHYMFEVLLLLAQCRIPVFMAGPAGSGKTTAAQSVAKALKLDCEAISFGPMTTQANMFGYKDANGIYHDTPLVRSALKGKVFLGDEVDAANPAVLTGINMVLANGHIALPEGMKEKHENFVPIFAGNTFGTGANRQYVGRNQLDAATLDRFAFIEWDYDLGLEASYAGVSAGSPEFDLGRGGSVTAEQWLLRVQILRHQAERLQQRMVISPRAVIYGTQLIKATEDSPSYPPIGLDVLEDMLIWKGTDKATKDKITSAL